MPIALRATFTHTLFGVTMTGTGEIPADQLDKVPADDLTRRILSGDYAELGVDPEKDVDRYDLLRRVLAERDITLEAPVEVPEDGVIGRFEPEASRQDDNDLRDAGLAGAAAVAEAQKKAALVAEWAELTKTEIVAKAATMGLTLDVNAKKDDLIAAVLAGPAVPPVTE